MKLEWDESYSVGVSELDEQHKKLFELVGQIEHLSSKEDFKTKIFQTLDELMEYVMIHFHTEEDYMKSGQYPNLQDHIYEHQKISEDVNQRVNYIMNKEPTALDLVMIHNFLVEWLKDHIMVQDQGYREFVKHLEVKK